MCSHSAFAGDSLLYRHTLKTNVLLYPLHEANLAYEYRFDKRFALEATLALVWGGFKDTQGFYGIGMAPAQGQVIRINPKYYPPNWETKSQSAYLSIMYQFKHLTFNNVSEDAGESNYNPSGIFNQTRYVQGVSLIVGWDKSFGRLLVDEFVGIGFKFAKGTTTYTEYYPMSYSSEPDVCPCQPFKFKENVPVINIGVKLGYQFKPITSRHI
jgi:hypothetical protein